MTVKDVKHTQSAEVWCDGGIGALGHPRVFLHIDPKTGKIICPYCSRTYILTPAKAG